MIRSLKKTIKTLPINEETTTRVIYNGTKLSSHFSLKDCTPSQHEHNVIYELTCPNHDCSDTYIGETGRRIAERIKEHGTADNKSHMAQHAERKHHKPVTMADMKILARLKGNNLMARKMQESILIRHFKPTINVQGASIPLKLFN